MDDECKLRNDFIAFESTALHCEHQLEVPFFHPPQSIEWITPPHSSDLLLDHDVSSHSYSFIQMSFEGVIDRSFYPLMINARLKTRDALGSNMVFDDAPFLLAPL